MSQIVFNITKDATVPSLNGLTVTFEGMNTTADFALANGALSNVGAAAKIAAVVDETAATAKTIVLPAAALADVKVVFNLNGKTFTADYPQKELLTGRKYTHNVKLSDSNGQPVIVMDAASIEDWITVPGGDIDVDFGDGTDVPEPSEVVVLDESFNAGQGAFTIDNKDLGGMNFVWAHKVFESVGYMKASGYYNNTANACESWLVSPNVDLSKATKATLTFMHCDNNSKVDLAARQTVMTLWATEVATEQWEQIAIPTYGAGTDYVYVSSGDIDLSKYAGKSMKFAFKYVCNGDFSATWQIQNVKVVADAGEGGGTVDPDPEPDPTPGEEVILYEETLGTPAKVGNNWPYADAYTGYTDTHNMTLSSYSTSIRSVDDIANIWFPKTKPSCYFQVSGFDTSNYTNLKFTFEIAGENSTDNQDLIAVETDKGTVTVPSATVEKSPNYHPVALTLQDGMTWLKISNDNSTASFRIAKLKVVGTTK